MPHPIEAIITQLRYAKELIEAQGIDIDPAKLSPLSMFECQVLQLLVQGYSTKEIAAKLYKSTRTIEGARYRILGKLRSKTLAQAVGVAFRRGILK